MSAVADPVVTLRAPGRGVARLADVAVATPVAPGAAQSWRLNSGAEMVTCVEGLNQGAPFILVIDLASVTFVAPEIEMMREHYVGPIGRWTGLTVALDGPKGPGIYGAPIFYTSETDAEREMYLLREADEVAALLKRKHPWQASVEIGGAVEQYRLIPPGESISVNGNTHVAPAGAGAMPLMVLDAGVCSEASVCLRGADRDTGPTVLAARAAAAAAKLAATTKPTKEIAMDLKALLAKYDEKHHGKIARLHIAGKTADEIATALLADDKQATDGEIAALKSKLAETEQAHAAALAERDAKVAELQGKIDAIMPPADKQGDGKVPPAGGDAASQLGAPKTITAGMARLTSEGSKLSGFPLRKAALAKWPSLRAELNAKLGIAKV